MRGWICQTITSIAVVLYCSIVGESLLHHESDATFMKQLAAAGAVLIIAGLVLHPAIPIIKRMFTPSYTLLSCGIVSLAFLLFFGLIDVAGKCGWSFFFVIFGMNSIFVYMLNGLLKAWLLETGTMFLVPVEPFTGAWMIPLIHAFALAAEWLVCLWLYRRNIFFKL